MNQKIKHSKIDIKIICFSFLTAFILLPSVLLVAKNNVELSVLQRKKIEIVLSKNESNMNVSNFQSDVYAELANLGIDERLVDFTDGEREEVSTSSSDAETIFNSWGRIGADCNWYYSSGEIVNPQNQDPFSGFYNKDSFEYQDITLSYDSINLDGDDDAIGAMIRFNVDASGKCTTYLFLINRIDDSWTGQSGLFKIVNNSFNYTSRMLLAPVSARWPADRYANYKIKAEGNNIKIYMNGSLILDYTDNNNPIYKGSYGFFSWSQPAKFKNVQIETVSYNSFSDTLLNSPFDYSKIHAVINIADREEEEFNDESLVGTILSRTINEQIHYIGLGTETNKEQLENFIQKNDNNGIFIDNTNYENAVKQTAQYIKSLLDEYSSSSEYLILGEDATLKITPDELKNNTANSNYIYGKWKIVHDYTYFENNNGQYENSGKYINDFPDSFTNLGKYEIFYEDYNIIPQYIYIHRRPEAVITLNRKNNDITLSAEKSYDLDKKSVNNGISEVEWSYKKANEIEWTSGILTNIEDDEEYIVRLRVKDYQNTWSNYATKYITTKPRNSPSC